MEEPRRLDLVGRCFIKNLEQLSLVPYLDSAGVATIGWGHTKDVTMQTAVITGKEADKFFTEDVAIAEAAVNKVKIELTQNEFNALVSFTFNEGAHRFLSSTLFSMLNLGDRQGAAKQFDRWIYYHDPLTLAPRQSKGLKVRRANEKVLFLSDFQTARSVAPAPG